jgi:hypothetical protein
MSLHVTLSEDKTITVIPAQVETLSAGDINIIKIIDFPIEKKVYAYFDPVGRILLDSLSGDNYNGEWKNSDIQPAVLAWISANS